MKDMTQSLMMYIPDLTLHHIFTPIVEFLSVFMIQLEIKLELKHMILLWRRYDQIHIKSYLVDLQNSVIRSSPCKTETVHNRFDVTISIEYSLISINRLCHSCGQIKQHI